MSIFTIPLVIALLFQHIFVNVPYLCNSLLRKFFVRISDMIIGQSAEISLCQSAAAAVDSPAGFPFDPSLAFAVLVRSSVAAWIRIYLQGGKADFSSTVFKL